MKSFSAPCVNATEFSGFWSEPPTAYCAHRFDTFPDGRYHIAEILKANPWSVHRAYPTWQPWKTVGAFGPSMLSLDFKYHTPPRTAAQWFSVLTLARAAGDGDWDPVCLNIDERGNLRLMHVPSSDLDYVITLGDTYVTMDTWHHIDVAMDFRSAGMIVVILNGRPIIQAPFTGAGGLQQTHAGLYASGMLASGWMANSNFCVQELSIERKINS